MTPYDSTPAQVAGKEGEVSGSHYVEDVLSRLRKLEKAVESGKHYGFQQDIWTVAADEIERLRVLLKDIGDKAHDLSTGPAVPDGYWEIRGMAYEQ